MQYLEHGFEITRLPFQRFADEGVFVHPVFHALMETDPPEGIDLPNGETRRVGNIKVIVLCEFLRQLINNLSFFFAGHRV